MKKILMRSAMPFSHDKNISEILIYNFVGNNAGNLLFHNSVARMLMTSNDVEIVTTTIKKKYSEEEVERINAEYEMFIIPLANAFRITFMDELENMTNLVRRLTIPCIVIGIGMQRNLDAKSWNYIYDDVVSEFVKAVLDKSAIIGIRGEITAEYLRHRGFVEERDFTIVGCPSLYIFGDNLPAPRLMDLTPKSKTAVNYKADLPETLYRFLRREADKFEDNVFVSQILKEIKALYVGYPYPEEELRTGRVPEDYPISFTRGLMKEDRMVGFLDEVSWVNWLKTRNFSFGSRIHGNIASILAGTPCFILAGDARVKELAEYHNIPHMSYRDIDENTNIFELYDKADYHALKKGHRDRVTHYLDFLDENQVERISREVMNSANAPFDHLIKNWNCVGAIRPFSVSSSEEQERRIQEYIYTMEEKGKEQRRKITERFQKYKIRSREKLKEVKKKQTQSEKELEKVKRELDEIKQSKFYRMKVKYDLIRKKIEK